ncbi:DEAD-box ATP-dependent RNA helicase 24 [Tanacetum coccineum]|uniref:DEAD-box ATP-dependent RNA helicase 24 n=1 Tax=Tanacetum coccineum TaxID=301880 RepID=A0ABQ5CG83_9ASTR
MLAQFCYSRIKSMLCSLINWKKLFVVQTYNASAESVLGRIQAETNDDQEMAPKVERSQGKKYKKKNIFGGQEVCKSLCYLLDEADRMFDLRFEPQIRSIVGQIRPDHQTSALFTTMPRKIEKLAREILNDPVKLLLEILEMANEDITRRSSSTYC